MQNSERNLIIATMVILVISVGVGGYTTTSTSNKEAIGTSQENGSKNNPRKWMDIHGVGCSPQEKTMQYTYQPTMARIIDDYMVFTNFKIKWWLVNLENY